MTSDEVLVRLAEATADAVAEALDGFAGGKVERGAAAVVQPGTSPFAGISPPVVVAKVDYVDGIAGGNIFVLSRAGAHRLAAAMTGSELKPGQDQTDVGALELSALGDAANFLMAAAATATTAVLGHEVGISAPETSVLHTLDEAARDHELAAHATVVSFLVMGEPCTLIQLVPNSFVVRMTKASADFGADALGSGIDHEGRAGHFSPELLRRVPVRVSVELGRARMPLARAVGMPPGAVMELDRAADDPVDLFVNGKHFAEGRLVLLDGNEWGLHIERLLGAS